GDATKSEPFRETPDQLPRAVLTKQLPQLLYASDSARVVLVLRNRLFDGLAALVGVAGVVVVLDHRIEDTLDSVSRAPSLQEVAGEVQCALLADALGPDAGDQARRTEVVERLADLLAVHI